MVSAVAVATTVAILAGCGTFIAALPTPTATLVPLPPLDPGTIARGRAVYLQNCARCHGQNAEGAPNWQKPDARGDLPPPPHDDTGHTWRHGDAQLKEIIRDGMRDPFNKTLELTMPQFKGSLTDEEIAAVIAYFKSLWSPEHRHYQEEMTQKSATPGLTR